MFLLESLFIDPVHVTGLFVDRVCRSTVLEMVERRRLFNTINKNRRRVRKKYSEFYRSVLFPSLVPVLL